jgi:two-component system, cell cycle sensor histidine kinase and response regulator CckA
VAITIGRSIAVSFIEVIQMPTLSSRPNADLPEMAFLSSCVEARPPVVLLIEDEEFLRQMAGGVLEAAGHRVLQAANASEAKGLFERYGKIIDLVVTDVILPGKNGQYLVEEMRTDKPELMAMFISGYAETATSQRLREIHGDEYLPKPFSADSLLKKVKQLVQH